MFKKILSALICPIMLIPIFSAGVPTRAVSNAVNPPIVGKWIWGSTIADLGADGAEIMMSRCADEGITDVYLLVKGTGGMLGYLNTQYKNLLTRKNRDVLQETIDAGHKRGIRIHAWICVVEDESYKSIHPDAGMWHYIRARDNNFITPWDEGYREYMGNVAKELAQYDIDGLHFDYIRYNHNANGWSEKDFENLAAMGANVERVKELVETTWGYHGRKADSNYIFSAYKNNDPYAVIIAKYRRNNVKELAKHIIDSARSINPNLIFSAATMPEGAYENAYADLHYGQNYDDAAELYDYICPMAYSTNYGKADNWVVTLAKNSIDKGNRVVMGIQVFDSVTSARIMAEMENIRDLMKDSKYGSGMLGTVFFRSGTFEYAKATYDTANKIITVKIDNNGSSAYTQVRVEGKNGIKLTDASIGDGINENTTVTLSSNGSYVTFKKSNLLPAGKEGYLYLKYDGEVDPTKLPVLVRMYTSSGESRVYTVFCDTNAKNADIGSPIFSNHEESTAESTEIEPAEAESTKELIPDSEATQTTPTDNADENNSSLILPIALGAAAAAAICAVVFIISKKKRK
ncbi:MAG: family 10 glycosylhydrolase [Clostridia bacterium]|nr:family 10 glycosylhydrolase [Clostridia bacterium]